MLRKLSKRVEPLLASATGQDAYVRFSQNPDLNAIAVVDQDHHPVGLLSRNTFFLRFGDTWGRPLFERRSVTRLMERDPLLVEGGLSLDELAAIVVGRAGGKYMDGFIVIDNGRYWGVGSGLDVFRATLEQNRAALERAQRLNAELDRLLQLRNARSVPAGEFMREATRSLSMLLEVERAGIWLFSEGGEELICADLYQAGNCTHVAGMRISGADHPRYFKELKSRRAIVADDAMHDFATSEFAETYLKPNGIRSMLDAQIYSGAAAKGVVCCETMVRRRWAPEEASFCASLAEIVGLVMLAEELDAERRNLEERVRLRTAELETATEEAQSANRSKTQFLANMSHELRTPLNAIIGYSELLIETASEEAREAEAEDLRRILGASRRLLGLINGVLDMAKVEAGKMELEIAEFDPAALAREALDQVRPAAEAHGDLLQLTVIEPLPKASSDGFKLGQCLLNLLSNAVKFTRDGRISVRVALETAAGGAPMLVYEVADTGIGISPEQLQRLFTPFMQADASMTRRFGGTGLGLAITRRIAQLLGGDVTVASAPGHGSTFTLRAPLHYRQPIQANAA